MEKLLDQEIRYQAISFTPYFTNKMGYRSYSNNKSFNKIKKKSNEIMLCAVLGISFKNCDCDMFNSMFSHMEEILSQLKYNLRKNRIDDSKHFARDYVAAVKELQPVDKCVVTEGLFRILLLILPKELFGVSRNYYKFRNIINKIVHLMNGECIIAYSLIEDWNICNLKWCMFTKNDAVKKEILCRILIWIIINIVLPVLSIHFYVTCTKLSNENRKLYYFWKSNWQQYHDLQMYRLISEKSIIKLTEMSVGSKLRKQYSILKKNKLRKHVKEYPKLILMLKKDRTVRPILRYKKNPKAQEKFKIKEQKFFLKMLKKQNKSHFFDLDLEHRKLKVKWDNLSKPKLYFVKTDLSDAFGSVDLKLLLKILFENYTKVLRKEDKASKKQWLAKQYRVLVSDLKSPVLMRYGSSVYLWNRGLIQGLVYSPALSEIYYNYFDNEYLGEIINKPYDGIQTFIRIVDDYLFITDDFERAKSFLVSIAQYKNINMAKTTTNFTIDGVEYNDIFNYLGYTLNTSTLEMSRLNTSYTGQICYNVKFSKEIENPSLFMESRIFQSSVPFTKSIFDLQFGNEENVWREIFLTFCISANKFCTIFAILLSRVDKVDCYINIYKRKVSVKLTNVLIRTIYKNKPDGYNFVYCINHFCYLSYKALFLIAINIRECSKLLPLIKHRMAQTDCMNGKWRDHASRIESDGNVSSQAIREICRRPLIKKIIEQSKELPKGIECYKGLINK